VSISLPSQGHCPLCKSFVSFDEPVCPDCGFPFSCDIAVYEKPSRAYVRPLMRVLAALIVVLFSFTNGSLIDSGYAAYHGQTHEIVARLAADHDSGIPISGPPDFVHRTKLVLALLELRAPDFYWRVQDSVRAIGYFDRQSMFSDGQKIDLSGIGAMAEPASGNVTIMSDAAYPSGRTQLYDGDLFSFAGTLIHELRHIELHAQQIAPGGWEEEMLCEQAAYDACLMMQAPPGVLARYQVYLADPQHRRYKHWYDWYDQFDAQK
jgi:hypothetical protein